MLNTPFVWAYKTITYNENWIICHTMNLFLTASFFLPESVCMNHLNLDYNRSSTVTTEYDVICVDVLQSK